MLNRERMFLYGPDRNDPLLGDFDRRLSESGNIPIMSTTGIPSLAKEISTFLQSDEGREYILEGAKQADGVYESHSRAREIPDDLLNLTMDN